MSLSSNLSFKKPMQVVVALEFVEWEWEIKGAASAVWFM